MTPRGIVIACLLALSNYCFVLANERSGGFTTKRYKVLGLCWDLVVVIGIPCAMITNYSSSFFNLACILAAADFGNSRECSLRWMLYGAKRTGAMRWVMALCKNIHHICVFFAFVILEDNAVAKQPADTQFVQLADKVFLVEFLDHMCFLTVRLRFKALTQVVMPCLILLTALVIANLALPYFVELPWLTSSKSMSSAVHDSRLFGICGFSGTICYDVLDLYGGYLKSRKTRVMEIRGRERKRSLGGAKYDLETITAKGDYESSNHLSESEDLERSSNA